MQARKGFTLIEMMIVIVILGIIMLGAIPMYSAYVRRQAVQNEANVAASAIERAETEAKRIGITGALTINADPPANTMLVSSMGGVLFSNTMDSQITAALSASSPAGNGTVSVQFPAPGGNPSFLMLGPNGVPILGIGVTSSTATFINAGGYTCQFTIDAAAGAVSGVICN